MTDFTTNLHFELVDFNTVTWHDQEHNNWIITDAAIRALGATGILGIWQNSTAYVAGNRLVDSVSFNVWECLVDHVSAASPTTFAADRTANPTFWTPLSAFTGITYLPIVDDMTSLGAAIHRFANLYLKSGGTINFNNGNYIITHSAGLLSFNGSVLATISFIGASNVVLATSGANTIFLRPNGSASSTNQITIDSTGLVDMSGAAGQIKFPSTQNPSANANTFDDYEEGTYTPIVAFGGSSVGVTYGEQLGTYTKLGNWVNSDFRITLTSKGAAAGTITMGGLPFTVNNTYEGVGYIGRFANFTGLTGMLCLNLGSGGTSVTFNQWAAASSAQVANTAATNTLFFLGGCGYQTN